MARTIYQLSLSADGNHKVSASTDDPAELKSALEHVKNVYGWMDYFIQQGELGKIKQMMPANTDQKSADQGAQPVCAVHHESMKWIDRNGGFWSCHKKNGDGSWCNYRPGKGVA